MLELREFHLELALPGARALREDVEDERGAIQNLALEHLLQITALRGRKIVVEDDRIHTLPLAMRREFIRLARADEGRGEGSLQFLRAAAEHLAAGGGGQLLEFRQGILHGGRRLRFEFNANEEDALGCPAGGFDECFQYLMTARKHSTTAPRENKKFNDLDHGSR